MITFFTGAPGTGKSAACVALIAELAKGRTVYANGVPDLLIPHEVLEDVTKWPEVVPDGSIIFIDEVQRIWRPRGPGQKVPPDIQALETHRHRGIDFYIVSQGPRLVDANIRALTGRHVHLRDVGILGRYWYEWPECADNCATAWKNAPIKKRYKLPKHVFTLYKSASVHIKPIRSFPWMLVVLLGALTVAGVVSFNAYKTISEKINPTAPAGSLVPSVSTNSIGPQSQPSQDSQSGPLSVADYVASYEPRIAGMPHTAPRYDQITQPTTAPYPAACIRMKNRCDCYSQQGTKLQTPADVCAQVVKAGYFVDWDTKAPGDGSASPSGGSGGAGPGGGGGGGGDRQTLQGNPGQSPEVQFKPAPKENDSAQAIRDGQTLAAMRPARQYIQ